MTIVDMIEREEKKNLKPGPGAYEDKTKIKYIGAFNLKDAKSLSFVDDAEYLSKQTPTPY
jgi:hypothetical protein